MGQSNQKQFSARQEELIQYANTCGLTIDEIVNLEQAFNSLKPDQNMKISVERMRRLYSQSFDKEKIDEMLQGRRQLSFIEFLTIMSEDLKEKKLLYKNIQFESQRRDQHLCYCPMAQNE